jgi:rfaE bifunctional protein kinase chain/domain
VPPNAPKHLENIIKRFPKRTLGVLGDFMLDELLRGEATRLSPEAPVPVVLMPSRGQAQIYPGGAGNVAANISALGGRPIPFGAIGDDHAGNQLREALQALGISAATLVREHGRVTPHKMRIAAHQHQLLRLDFESPSDISTRTMASLLSLLERWEPRLDGLIVSDYRKGSVTADLCANALTLAHRRHIPVFIDPKPEHTEMYYRATCVTPNLKEAEAMAGCSLRTSAELEKGGRKLLKKLDCAYVAITRGAEGVSLFEATGDVHHLPAVSRPVYDVTGAGDTFIATLALAYASGATMKDALMLSNEAGGQVVLKFGTAQITPQDLIDSLEKKEEG